LGAHGGITFSGLCQEGCEEQGVCHKPAEGEPDHVWWFGFDCAHCDDLSPGTEALLRGKGEYALLKGGYYHTLQSVQDGCARLAEQLKQIAEHGFIISGDK
jgi:hypothetical protein